MKTFLLPALLLAGLPLPAQTTSTTTSSTTAPTAPPPQGGAAALLAQLTPAEKTQLTNARTQAMTADPSLQTEEMGLMQKGMSLQAGTPTEADKQAFVTEIRAHVAKVRAGMLKADPTVAPVLAKIDQLEAQYRPGR